MTPAEDEGPTGVHRRLDEPARGPRDDADPPVGTGGVSVVNLSVLKNDRARAIRYSTLSAICRVLDCEIGELLVRAD